MLSMKNIITSQIHQALSFHGPVARCRFGRDFENNLLINLFYDLTRNNLILKFGSIFCMYAHFSLAAKGRMIVLGYINSYHSPAGIDRSHRDATLVTKVGLFAFDLTL